VVCAGGRSRVVRRAVLQESSRGKAVRGTLITDASAAGPLVAIASLAFRPGRRAGRVDVVARDGRVVRSRGAGTSGARPVEAVLLDRGELAWTTLRGTLLLDRGRGVERIAGAATDLAVEDGRTLRWDAALGAYALFDVRPSPGPGCPRRSAYAVVAENAEVVVTRARFRFGASLRACLRASARDRPLGGDADDPQVRALAGPWVVLAAGAGQGGDGCRETLVDVVDVRTGSIARRLETCDVGGLPGRALVVTAAGAPAWVAADRATGEDVLRTITADGRLAVLDRAAAGAIGALRAEGEVLAWTRAGAERRARP
jgi:hypothetical protein